MEAIGKTYKEATLGESKINVSSSDEKPGIQALRHLRNQKAKPGQVERRDPEYVRNGTSSLIASINVSTGKINAYSLGGTREEKDYLNHVKEIVAIDPSGEHVIICDQLNIHKSASLVEWVAAQIGFTGDLGAKRRKGILRSIKSRMEFLEDKQHRIRFLYTPKHCSWLNQIENWFGKLQKQVLKRGEFSSVDDLENKINNYISYYNLCMATPYNWKFEGEKYRRLFMN